MYRKTFASIEQSTHEQLFERDCRCMRVAEKSLHTFSPPQLCHLYMPCEWRKYGECSQDVRSCGYKRHQTLCTGTRSEYFQGYAKGK